MGLPKTCPNCFANDGIFWNYDGSEEEIKKIYDQKWCDCGYNSPEEMIEGLAKKYEFKFKDPKWVKLARAYIDRKNYKEDKRTIITLKEVGEFLHDLYWSSKFQSLNINIENNTKSKTKNNPLDPRTISLIEKFKGRLPNNKLAEMIAQTTGADPNVILEYLDSKKRYNLIQLFNLETMKTNKVIYSILIFLIVALSVSIFIPKKKYVRNYKNVQTEISKDMYDARHFSNTDILFEKNYPIGILSGLIVSGIFYAVISRKRKSVNK